MMKAADHARTTYGAACPSYASFILKLSADVIMPPSGPCKRSPLSVAPGTLFIGAAPYYPGVFSGRKRVAIQPFWLVVNVIVDAGFSAPGRP